jgi:hypothetical protein
MAIGVAALFGPNIRAWFVDPAAATPVGGTGEAAAPAL